MNSYYLINLLIYAAVDAMACLGLSQQFGVAGVTNFGFIIFQAAGGYTAAVLALPADSADGGFQSYLGGWNLPFPIPWIGAAVVGGLIALPFTFLVGRRLRGDFAAVGLLVTAVLLNLLATNYRPLLNGAAGLSLIPQPLQGEYNPQSSGYEWALTAVAVVLCAAVYLLVRRITESPYGRSLRAMRDNDTVADSLGKNLLSLRTAMLVVGGAIAGLSGGILISYITTWSPAAWGYAETVVLFAAVIIGGAGQPPRRDPGGDPRPRRLRRDHPLHPHLQQPAPKPDPIAAVGGDRPAHRDLPLGAAAGHPAGAQARDQGGAAPPVRGPRARQCERPDRAPPPLPFPRPPRRPRRSPRPPSRRPPRRHGTRARCPPSSSRPPAPRQVPGSRHRMTARSCSRPSTWSANSAGSGPWPGSPSPSGAGR